MTRWLLLFSTILATSFIPFAARAQIPGFVQEGLVVTYAGTVALPGGVSQQLSKQKITVTSVTPDSVGNTIVGGITQLTNFIDVQGSSTVTVGSKTVRWTCSVNQKQTKPCTIIPAQLGAIAQFWVNTTNSISSILTPEGNSYNPYMGPNPTNVSPPPPAIAMTCPDTIDNITCVYYHKLIPPAGATAPNNVCAECLLLAFDTTGLIEYSTQWFEPFATFSGAIGELIYTFQSMLPPQSDSTRIFWQDNTGTAKISELDGTTVTDSPSIPKPAPGKFIVGIGDFNGDGKSDILWRNGGALSIWELNDETKVVAQGRISDIGTIINPGPGPGWHVVGTGDFNRDGKSDILLQKGTDKIDIWLMNGTEHIGELKIPNPNPGQGWHAVGMGDFNLDGKSDILWWNDTGEFSISEMDGTRVIKTSSIANPPHPDWQALGVGNFYGNGKSVILFENSKTGQVAIWKMNGNSAVQCDAAGHFLCPITDTSLPAATLNTDPRFRVVGVSDYHSDDSTVDILFQNKSTGAVKVWGLKEGTSRKRHGPIASGGFFVMGVGE